MNIGRVLRVSRAIVRTCAVAGVAAVLLSADAFAEPAARRDAGANAAGSNGAPEIDPMLQAARAEEDARRADNVARDARSKATSLGVVSRLARSKVDALAGAEKLEAEEGLAHLQVVIATHEASYRSEERAAAEHRLNAERLRARVARGDGNVACDPPYWFDPEGRKRWRPECF